MAVRKVDLPLLNAWLSARSIARHLPLPVFDHGGLRVDVNSESETSRWVFTEVGCGLRQLARAIDRPRYFLKLCGTSADLRAALPAGWEIQSPGYFMHADKQMPVRSLPLGYSVKVVREDSVLRARITTRTGELAASGYAVETSEVFIYDRIVTEAKHRRRGLGACLMQSLQGARKNVAIPELLVATEDGRALYLTLGWETVSPYTTATIAP